MLEIAISDVDSLGRLSKPTTLTKVAYILSTSLVRFSPTGTCSRKCSSAPISLSARSNLSRNTVTSLVTHNTYFLLMAYNSAAITKAVLVDPSRNKISKASFALATYVSANSTCLSKAVSAMCEVALRINEFTALASSRRCWCSAFALTSSQSARTNPPAPGSAMRAWTAEVVSTTASAT